MFLAWQFFLKALTPHHPGILAKNQLPAGFLTRIYGSHDGCKILCKLLQCSKLASLRHLYVLQWTPLNGIKENIINQLMGSNLSILTKSQITLSYLLYIESHSHLIISWLLESIYLYPEVIPLSSFHCTYRFFRPRSGQTFSRNIDLKTLCWGSSAIL